MKIKKLKQIGATVAVSAVTAFACLFAYGHFFGHQEVYMTNSPVQAHYASYDSQAAAGSVPDNFTNAANTPVQFFRVLGQ